MVNIIIPGQADIANDRHLLLYEPLLSPLGTVPHHVRLDKGALSVALENQMEILDKVHSCRES